MMASHIAWYLESWRLIVLAIGTINVGLTLILLWLYVTNKIKHTAPLKYIIFLTISYISLSAASCTEIGLRAVRRQPIISYRLGFGTIAFLTGVYALTKLIAMGNETMGFTPHEARKLFGRKKS